MVCLSLGRFLYLNESAYICIPTTERRDARVVEEARLESVYTCQRVSRVRIPVPPPSPAEAGYGGQSPPVGREGGPPAEWAYAQQEELLLRIFFGSIVHVVRIVLLESYFICSSPISLILF